ncbi:MAG: hypothetical protein PHI02_04410 [Sulfurovaceae bacterium]|nr:hypothetical protein [Sulfurovaceae bacterium]
MASVGTVVIEVDANVAKLVEGMKQAKSQVSALQKNFNTAKRDIADFAKAVVGIYALKQGLDVAKAAAISFVNIASDFEQMKIGLASLIAVNSSNVTSLGKSITETEKYALAQGRAAEAVNLLRRANIDTPATLNELVAGFQATLGPAMHLNFTIEQTVKYTTLMTQAAAAMRVPMNQLSQEMRSVLAANIDNNSIIAKTLGITNEQIKMHIKLGDTYDFLTKKLEGFAASGEDMSKSQEGIISNMQDSWQGFQLGVMDSGLFDYIKATELTISQELTKAFLDADQGVKIFSTSAISGFEGIINAIGFTYDSITGIQLAWEFVKTTFNGVVAFIVGGINYFIKAWDWAGVNLQNTFKIIVETIGNMWNGMINFMIDGLNKLASGAIFGGLGGALELIGQKNPFKLINVHLGEFNSGIKTAKMSTKDFIDNTWTKDYQAGLENEKKLMGSLTNGRDMASKFIANIHKNLATIKKTDISEIANSLGLLQNNTNAAGDAADKAGGKSRKGHNDAAKAAREEAKAVKEAQEQYDRYYDTYTKYLESIGNTEKLAKLAAAQYMGELSDAGFLNNEEIMAEGAKVYYKKMEEANKDIGKDLKQTLSSVLESVIHGDFAGAFNGLLDSMIGDSVSKLSDSILSIFGGGSSSGAGPSSSGGSSSGSGIGSGISSMGWIGMAASVVGSALSTTVSEAELRAATGKTDFSDKSIQNLGDMFENVQYPLLEATNTMSKHIRNMDNNFQAVARAITGNASASGIDLTGANFVPTDEIGFIGLWSKNISLVSTGLQFEMQKLKDMMDEDTLKLRGYTTTLVKTSAIWGLIHREKLKNVYKNLPENIMNDMADSFASGYEAILTAGVTLGFNEKRVTEALNTARLNMGRIDFTGLTPGEVSDRLTMAVSEAFSGVINGIDMFTGLVDRYATANEYSLETLVRIATEYEQATHAFNLVGKEFIGVVDGLTSQMQVLDIIDSMNGMDNFTDAMNSFMSNFYTDAEQLAMQQKTLAIGFNTLGLNTIPKTRDEFRDLLLSIDTTADGGSYLVGQLLLLSDSFAKMTQDADSLRDATTSAINNIAEAWTGSLSYLSLQQKAYFASGIFAIKAEAADLLSGIDLARIKAETALSTSRTKEDYVLSFGQYIDELNKQNKEKNISDLYTLFDEKLSALIKATTKQEETMRYVG